MRINKKTKRVLISLSIILFIVLAVGYPTSIRKNSDIYIKTLEIDFLTYPPHQSGTSVSFRINMWNEIWNPNNHELEIGTGHSNLFDPKVVIDWAEEEYIYHVSYFAMFVCTIHKIAPGLNIFGSYVDLYIENYNETTPPDGRYNFRNEIDGYSEEHYTFGVRVYKTVVEFNDNSSTISYQSTPANWGKITYFPLDWQTTILLVMTAVEVVLITLLIYNKYYNNKRKEKGKEKIEDYLT